MNERPEGCLMLAADGTETAEMVATLLGQQGICVTRSVTVEECLDLLGTRSWRLLVIDANGDAQGPLRVLEQSRQAHPDVSVLVLVEQDDIATAVQVVKAGATDCIEKPVKMDRLLSVTATLRGQTGPGPNNPRSSLTKVERIVLRHVLDGQTNREIAEVLCRSRRTIEVHRRHIMNKLGAANLTDLVKQAMQACLIDGKGIRSAGR